MLHPSRARPNQRPKLARRARGRGPAARVRRRTSRSCSDLISAHHCRVIDMQAPVAQTLLQKEVPSPSIVAGAPQSAQETEAPGRILIVDDVADNRTILARRFQRRGFEITEADGGLSALELIAEQSF